MQTLTYHLLCARHWLKNLSWPPTGYHNNSTKYYYTGHYYYSHFIEEEPRHGVVKKLPQGHPATKWQSQDSNPSSPAWPRGLGFWPQHHALPVQIWLQLYLQRSGPCSLPESGGTDQISPAQADDAGASGCGSSNSSLEEQKSVQWSPQTLRSRGGWLCIHKIKKRMPPSQGISLRMCIHFQNFPDDLLQLSLLECQNTVIPWYPWGIFWTPPQITKSSDAQVPYIKWYSICL